MSMTNSTQNNFAQIPSTTRSNVVMMAEGPTISGDTEIDLIEDFQKHPDLKHDGLDHKEELIKNALYLSTPGKGVLATDE